MPSGGMDAPRSSVWSMVTPSVRASMRRTCSQFTNPRFTQFFLVSTVKVSVDGRRRRMDNPRAFLRTGGRHALDHRTSMAVPEVRVRIPSRLRGRVSGPRWHLRVNRSACLSDGSRAMPRPTIASAHMLTWRGEYRSRLIRAATFTRRHHHTASLAAPQTRPENGDHQKGPVMTQAFPAIVGGLCGPHSFAASCHHKSFGLMRRMPLATRRSPIADRRSPMRVVPRLLEKNDVGRFFRSFGSPVPIVHDPAPSRRPGRDDERHSIGAEPGQFSSTESATKRGSPSRRISSSSDLRPACFASSMRACRSASVATFCCPASAITSPERRPFS